MSQRPVPEYARVSKNEYTHWRSECQRTAAAAGYNWTDMWNLAIREIEKRHANVLKGKAKNELTLADAVTRIQKEAIKARMEVETERRQGIFEKVG